MYRFFAYGIESADRGIVGQIFKNKVDATNFCQQNNIPQSDIVMLYNFKPLPYVEPKDAEFIEP